MNSTGRKRMLRVRDLIAGNTKHEKLLEIRPIVGTVAAVAT
jgi:hypothetical protein